MLYNKYVIEVVYSEIVFEDVELTTNNDYSDGTSIHLGKKRKTMNTIKFLDENGNLYESPTFFYTYKTTYDVLEKYYDIISSSMQTIKIVEVYDNKVPSVNIMRGMKLEKLKKIMKNNG